MAADDKDKNAASQTLELDEPVPQSLDLDEAVSGGGNNTAQTTEKPGFLKRLGQSVGVPTSWDELKEAATPGVAKLFQKPKTLDEAKDYARNAVETLAPGTSTAGAVYDWGKRAVGNIGEGLKEEKEAGQNIMEGGPVLPNLGKAALGVIHGGIGSIPFVGPAIETAGQDLGPVKRDTNNPVAYEHPNYAGAAGGLTGVIGQIAAPELLQKAGWGAPSSSHPELEQALAEHKVAAPPTKVDLKYDENFRRSSPYLAEEARTTPVTSVREAYEASRNALTKVDAQVKGAAAQLPGETIDGDAVMQAARDAVSASKRTPEEQAASTKLLDGLGIHGQIPLADAIKFIERLNPELEGVQDATGSERDTLLKTNPVYAADYGALNRLRELVFDKFDQRGVPGVAEMRKDQSALMDMRDRYRENIVKSEKLDEKPQPVSRGQKIAGTVGAGLGALGGGTAGTVLGPGGAVAGAIGGRELGKVAGEGFAGKFAQDNRPNARIGRAFDALAKSDLHAPTLGTPTPNLTTPQAQYPAAANPARAALPAPAVPAGYNAGPSGPVRGGRWTTPAAQLPGVGAIHAQFLREIPHAPAEVPNRPLLPAPQPEVPLPATNIPPLVAPQHAVEPTGTMENPSLVGTRGQAGIRTPAPRFRGEIPEKPSSLGAIGGPEPRQGQLGSIGQPSRKATELSQPRKVVPEHEAQSWQEESDRNKAILRDPKATAEDKRIAQSRLSELEEVKKGTKKP